MSDSLDQVADDFWEVTASHEPTYFRHLLGDYSQVGSYEEASRAADARYADAMRDLARRAEAIDEGSLDEREKVTRSVIVFQGAASADLAATHLGDLRADPIGGIQIDLPLVMGLLTVPDQTVAEQMSAKLDAVGVHLREAADRVREGAADGWVPAEYLVRETIAQLETALATPLSDDPVVAAVKLPDGTDVGAFRDGLRDAVERSVRPGFEAYRDALRDVLPQARSEEHCGLSWLEGGEAAYAATLRFFTTTDKTAEEIHEIGLAQLAKLADEYRSLGPEVVGSDDLDTIFEAMRTDPKMHYEHAEELVENSRTALARAEAAMKDWFEVLPQASCAVEGTEVGAIAFYFPPATDGVARRHLLRQHLRPVGVGHASSSRRWPSTRACPGITCSSRSRTSCPRRSPSCASTPTTRPTPRGGGSTPSGSPTRWGSTPPPSTGWGCSSADSLRACRLVVDTGLHASAGAASEAVDFMVANSPLTEGIVVRRSTATSCSPGPGHVVHDRPPGDPADARRGRATAG